MTITNIEYVKCDLGISVSMIYMGGEYLSKRQISHIIVVMKSKIKKEFINSKQYFVNTH